MDVATMISDLGDHGFTDTSTATKVRMLQDAIWEIEGIVPWPFLETSITLTFDGSSPLATNFPTNFRNALKLKDVQRGITLDPTTFSDLDEQVGTQIGKVAVPQVYYPVAEQLKLWPVPPSDTTVLMRYIRWSDAITSGSAESAILLPARYHRLIVLGALVRLYDMEDDPELAMRFQSQYEARIERMKEDLTRKQYDRPEYVRVNDPDSWDYDI